MTRAERAAALLAGVAMALVLIGAPVQLMLLPAYTSSLVVRTGAPELTGLEPDQVSELAEAVRAYVAGADGAWLPTILPDGSAGFDGKAVSHLDDVRAVLAGARVATLAALAFAAAWVAWMCRARRREALSRSFAAGAWLAGGAVVLAALAGVVDFATLFAGFHGLFFEPGTWQFPTDALLIQLFPEAFWAVSAAVWAGLALAGAALLGVCARLARSRPRRAGA
mgnify:CR=1 FL=1